MVDSNLAIMNELKKFLEIESQMSTSREKYLFSPQSFSRKRTLTFERVVILIISALKRSLSLELLKFMEYFSPMQSCTKQAFSEQRVKLKPTFFQDWNGKLIQSFYRQCSTNLKTWKGLILWAVDGSTIPLPQTEALREVFGQASNQSENAYNVTARVCLVSDVLNDLVIEGILHPYFSSEEDVFLSVLGYKDMEGKLLIFDRGYPSYWLEYLLIEKGINFIMRVRKTENKQVISFLSTKDTDKTNEWYPSQRSLKKLKSMGIEINKQTPIRIRMVKILLDTGETEVLITNLYDTQLYDEESLKEAYHLRWGIETIYGNLKEKLQLGQFSGIRQICIEQDFAASLFIYNLQSLIEKQAAPYVQAVSRNRKYQYKINKNISLGILKERIVGLFFSNDSQKILRELEKLFGNYLEPVRPNRKYPRIKKRSPNGKYYTLTNYKRAI